jgi:hypothetical protein
MYVYWLLQLTAKITWSSIVGPFIATLALLFTIGSFWWLNARQGKLRSYWPHSFGFSQMPNKILLRFPLVLYNTGPKPIVVQDLRLSFINEPGPPSLPWRTSRSQLMPNTVDDPQLPAVFSVPGRQAQQHFIEFGIDSPERLPDLELATREHRVQVEVLLGHKRKWQRLVAGPLQAKDIELPTRYIAYSNSALRPVS